MNIGDLYQFALLIVLVGLVVGVGVLVLDKFGGTSGIGSDASTAINASRDAVGDIANDWMALIVVIGVLAVVLGLVIGAFAMRKR